MISEVKIDNSFLIFQFTMTDYLVPFRHDQKRCGSERLLFFSKDIRCKSNKLTVLLICLGSFCGDTLRKLKNSYFAILTIHINVISHTI